MRRRSAVWAGLALLIAMPTVQARDTYERNTFYSAELPSVPYSFMCAFGMEKVRYPADGVANISLFVSSADRKSTISLQLTIPNASAKESPKILASRRIEGRDEEYLELATLQLPDETLVLAISVYAGERVAFDWHADTTESGTKVVEVKAFEARSAEAFSVAAPAVAECKVLTK